MSIRLYRSWLPGGAAVMTAVLACDRCHAVSTLVEPVSDPAALMVVRNRLRIKARCFCGWATAAARDRESGRNTIQDVCPDCRRRARPVCRPWRRWK